MITIKDRLGQINEVQKKENLVLHRVSIQKIRVMKNILGTIIRKRELELARQPFADWYQQVFVVPFEDRFCIPLVDRTLHDCQQLMYLHNQHKAVLKGRLKEMSQDQFYLRNEQAEISRLKREKASLERNLDQYTAELRSANAEIENLYHNLQRIKAESQRLIQGGVDAVHTEEDVLDQRPTTSNFNRFR